MMMYIGYSAICLFMNRVDSQYYGDNTYIGMWPMMPGGYWKTMEEIKKIRMNNYGKKFNTSGKKDGYPQVHWHVGEFYQD